MPQEQANLERRTIEQENIGMGTSFVENTVSYLSKLLYWMELIFTEIERFKWQNEHYYLL